MATQLQLRQGTTSEHSTFIGAVGEVTVDTTKDVLVVHDGVTAGGFPVAAKANADGTIALIKEDGESAGVISADGLFNNTLTSTSATQALTANMGRVLNGQDVALQSQINDSNSKQFGVGQTWQDVTFDRAGNISYTNSTNRPIQVFAEYKATTNSVVGISVSGQVNGVRADSDSCYSSALTYIVSVNFTVPAGQTYSVTPSSFVSLSKWSELR